MYDVTADVQYLAAVCSTYSLANPDLQLLLGHITPMKIGCHMAYLQVVDRVRRKAAIFGQDITDNSGEQTSSFKVEPSTVADLYEQWIMPLTKQVQVAYLLRRLDC